MKKRILLVSSSGLGKGGTQMVIMSIVRNLSKYYIFDIVVFEKKAGYFDLEFEKYGGKIIRYPLTGSNKVTKKIDYYSRVFFLYSFAKKVIKSEKYSVVHCHNNFEAGPFLQAAQTMGVPIRIVHTHVITGKCRFIYSLIRKKYKSQLDRYSTKKLGCSRTACETLFGEKGWEVIPNPIRNDFYKEDIVNDALNGIEILQVGNLSTLKNQCFTIEIVKELKKRIVPVFCRFVGADRDGYVNKMDDMIARSELKDNVQLLPFDSDIPKLLEKSNAFLLPSRSEGFGIVLVEAQAMGVKCFASSAVPEDANCGGVQYLKLEDGPVKWADVIETLYNNGDLKRKQYDTAAFKEENVISVYKEIYSE